MSRSFYLAAAIALMMTINAWAEGTVGNGGNTVVCKDGRGAVVSATLLDFYEGKLDGFQPSLGDAAADVQAKLEFAFNRLDRLDPKRAERYRARAKGFFNDARFVEGSKLVDTQDSLHIAIPNGCTVEQTAVQRPKTSKDEKTFTLSRDVWNLLDRTNRAGIMIHEIVYEEMLANGQKNSRRARKFTARIASAVFESMSAEDYREAAQNLGLTVGGPQVGEAAPDDVFTEYSLDKWDRYNIQEKSLLSTINTLNEFLILGFIKGDPFTTFDHDSPVDPNLEALAHLQRALPENATVKAVVSLGEDPKYGRDYIRAYTGKNLSLLKRYGDRTVPGPIVVHDANDKAFEAYEIRSAPVTYIVHARSGRIIRQITGDLSPKQRAEIIEFLKHYE